MARLAFACVKARAYSPSRTAFRAVARALACGLVATSTVALTQPAQANSSKAKPAAQQMQLATADLNLLSAPSPKRTKSKAPVRQVGSGSYICSAAGFGRRSRCYAN